MVDLRVEDLRIRLGGNDILNGVSLTLNRGEVAALLGPSGSGKTTLLRAVAGLEEPYAGRVTVGEKVVFDGSTGINLPTETRGLGFVFQSYALWPHRTVEQNVAYSLKLRGVDAARQKQTVQQTLDSLGLGRLAARYPHELSGGQQQRVAIARALVYNPAVVLLDEPLSNLDAKLREEARAFLKELIERENLAALMVTHDQAEALAIANRILLLNGGVVAQEGTPEQMYNEPNSIFAAEFMGSNNRIDGQVSGTRIKSGDVTLEGVSRGEATRVEHDGAAIIRIESVGLAQASGPNQAELDLVTSMYLGNTWEHLFRGHGMTVRVHHDGALAAGRHRLHFPAEKLWIF